MPMFFSPSVKESLTTMGVHYTHVCTNSCPIDVTEGFKDGFQGPYHRRVLSFITHADIDLYPKAAVQLAIDYLRSIADTSEPGKITIPASHDTIVIDN